MCYNFEWHHPTSLAGQSHTPGKREGLVMLVKVMVNSYSCDDGDTALNLLLDDG